MIEGADEIVVNFSDGSKLKVDKVLGKDTKTDLALLKVTPKKPLTAVAFGSSGALKVGDWVMAIGNPFGLGGSVTVGIISAKQRDINSGPYDDFLQTDAAINRGNSGGPLFNMEGEVIGVNTAIISPTGGSIGIGFAVPSDTAVLVIDQLRQFGETRRGWLGVKIQSVTGGPRRDARRAGERRRLRLGRHAGQPGRQGGARGGGHHPALRRQGGLLVRGLPRLVAQTPIGRTVAIEVLRRGERKALEVTIGRLTEDEEAAPAAAKPETETAPEQSLIGLRLAPLTQELRAKFGIDDKVKGVVVTEVDPASPAASKNIKAGDVIVEAAQEQVATPEDVARSVEKMKKVGRKAVLLRVEDAKGDLRFVAVPLP